MKTALGISIAMFSLLWARVALSDDQAELQRVIDAWKRHEDATQTLDPVTSAVWTHCPGTRGAYGCQSFLVAPCLCGGSMLTLASRWTAAHRRRCERNKSF